MPSSSPALAVIVPVYNTADYLDACLDSLAAQTFSDIEIICVNDGSTDGSLGVLKRRAAADGRIRIIDKESGGVSAARNDGIRAARAPYVCFLDSDDRLVACACDRIMREFSKTGADVVTFGAYCVPGAAATPWMREKLSPRDVVYKGFDVNLLFAEQSMPYIRTACRRELLSEHDVVFPEGLPIAEDMVFLMKAYLWAETTSLISDKLYEYRMDRSGQATKSTNDDIRVRTRQHIAALDPIFRAWAERFPTGEHAGAVVDWSIEFVLYGALCLDEPDRSELLGAYRELYRGAWGELPVGALGLPGYAGAIVSAAFQGGHVGSLRALWLRLAYTRGRYGMKAIIGKLLGLN